VALKKRASQKADEQKPIQDLGQTVMRIGKGRIYEE
jgi:hypothetical protein